MENEKFYSNMRYTDWVYRKAIQLPNDTFWERLGYQPFTVNETIAKFDLTDPEVLDEIRIVILSESDYLKEILSNVKKDDVFFDIGAHVGVHSSFAASKITDGQVLAFEPVSSNIKFLEKNLGLNSGDACVFPIAITDKYGSTPFTQPENNRGDGGPLGSIATTEGNYNVETAPLDGFITDENLPKPNVIKVDVEGAEPLVLEGMENTLSSSSCRLLFLEVHLPTPHIDRPSIREFDSSVTEIMGYLRDIGFNVQVTNSRSWVLHLRAQKAGCY